MRIHKHRKSSWSMLWKNLFKTRHSPSFQNTWLLTRISPHISWHKLPCQSCVSASLGQSKYQTIVLFVCFLSIYSHGWETGFIKRLLPHRSSETKLLFQPFSKNTASSVTFLNIFRCSIHIHPCEAEGKNKHIALIEKSQFCSCPLANFTRAAKGKTKSYLFILASVGQNTENPAEVIGLRWVKRNLNQEKLEWSPEKKRIIGITEYTVREEEVTGR